MRWRHPEHGVILPAAFIEVMETHGLLGEATFDLIAKSLAEACRWTRAGIEAPIAVNVSADSLSDIDLASRIGAITDAAGFPPSALVIEVTESMAMRNVAQSLETLTRLRMKGFSVSVDDFGTGFASMRQLAQLPFTELKIDQGFVTGAAESAVQRAMIESSIMLAGRLNLRTVAEGVESRQDWDLVSQLGCAAAQGYFIGRPMPASQLPDWHTAWQARTPRADAGPVD
jgi:EAL domain-containing protein (putative c-di-GMP-specific phosphodiesterase class I)